ncbi:MAG: PilZ domain-containing protein [Nannocystaceae bacterium]|nr:PilZ domain-containing protein [bacterium]
MPSWFQRVFGRSTDADDDTADSAPAVQGNLATKQSAVERRSCARVNLELQVRLRFESPAAMIASRTFDISRNGAFIAIKDPRPRGTRVRLTLEIDDTKVTVSGVVVRSSDGKKGSRRGMGIQFTEIPDEAAKSLARLLEPHRA